MFEKILSMLGEDFFKDFDCSIFDEEPSYQYQSNDIKIIDEECKLFADQIVNIGNFEDEIMSIDDFNDMEKLLRRAGYVYMAIALNGASCELKRHVRNILCFKYMRDELNQEIKIISRCRFEDIINSQQFILRLL